MSGAYARSTFATWRTPTSCWVIPSCAAGTTPSFSKWSRSRSRRSAPRNFWTTIAPTSAGHGDRERPRSREFHAMIDEQTARKLEAKAEELAQLALDDLDPSRWPTTARGQVRVKRSAGKALAMAESIARLL